MIEFALRCVELAGKALLFLIVLKICWVLITKGKSAISGIIDTVLMQIRLWTEKTQRALFIQYKGIGKEAESNKPPKEGDNGSGA